MLPVPITNVLESLRQEHDELMPEIDQVRMVAREGITPDKIVRMILVQDAQGQAQLVFPANTLVDVDRLNTQLRRHLAALPTADVERLSQRLQLREIPAIPDITGLPAIADESLKQMSDVFLDTGDSSQLIHMGGRLFQSLLGKAEFLAFAVPLASIRINQDNCVQDLEQIQNAISKFTQLRIQQRLEDTLELPPLPETAQRVLKLRTNPDASVAELAEIVETDPSLSAQVVSWAGSSFYAAPSRVRSVQDAILRVLGFDLVMNLSMGLALGKTLKLPNDAPEGFTPYWQQAVWVATTASTLAILTPREHRPEFGLSYLSGLLHNFGYLVLAHVFPPHFSLICRYAECNRHLDPSYIEHHLLGITREQIGSKLMELWNMPPEVITALRHQKNPRYQGQNAVYSGLVFLATQQLRARGIIAGPAETIPASLYHQLHLNPADVQSALDELLKAADELTAIAASLDLA